MREHSPDAANPGSAARPARRPIVGFICGLVGFLLALSAGFLFTGAIPGWTSGAAMLLLIFMAVPLACVGLGLSVGGWRHAGMSRTAYVGVVLALVVLLSAILVLTLIYLGWSRCAPNCV
ncbi:MAG TPA: hypothetical protein VGR88_05750 [Ktedonobacterales bacterium]|nr:hypothetical protein [Ktedonobacterales bacterium]